ncbi:lipoprotein [Microtetraspora sp. NBRC 13810]|uniref:DUF305 domain-containing protein n=1 Tax=Microtetraspora sp. NBRC 13810 TaxID=3030990 RepID=UPI0024A1007F|nr:DUF305 domain-containing protein [Microtetraspora sp. NBRC 13810]GLW05341.1 lipoprotein [Microtetraspora sp. NBRC 13810]
MRAALLCVTGATLIALTGCSDTPAPAAAQTAPVIAPGRPGEQARTLGPEEAATAAPAQAANAADIRFMQDMIIHHRQALDMSVLAPSRAQSEPLKRLAARIQDVQGPEITMMSTWLQQQSQPVPEHHAAHGNMPGMATPEQMAALKAASGTAFDELYIQLMTAHHQGAIKMAEEVLRKGSHIRVQELAEDISVSQSVEIARMHDL